MQASLIQTLKISAVFAFAVPIVGNPLWAQQATSPTSGQTRTEKDLLGEKQVPADAYYGVQTQRALENFQLSGVAQARRRTLHRTFATGLWPDSRE